MTGKVAGAGRSGHRCNFSEFALALVFANGLCTDDFESGNTDAWLIVVP